MRSDDWVVQGTGGWPQLSDGLLAVAFLAGVVYFVVVVVRATWSALYVAQSRIDRDVQLARMASGRCLECGARPEAGDCCEAVRHG